MDSVAFILVLALCGLHIVCCHHDLLVSDIKIDGKQNAVIYTTQNSIFSIHCRGIKPTEELKWYLLKENGELDLVPLDSHDWDVERESSVHGKVKTMVKLTLNRKIPLESSQSLQLVCKAGQMNSTVYVHPFKFEEASLMFNSSVKMEKVLFRCDVTKPDNFTFSTSLQWYKGQTKLVEGAKYKGVDSAQLTILNPVPTDTALYRCVVSIEDTKFPRANVSHPVHYYGEPHVAGFLGGTNKVNGDWLKWTCNVTGHPISELLWWKDGEVLSANNHVRMLADEEGRPNRTISIANLEFSDSGVYQCTAMSRFGNSSHTLDFKVKDRYAALWPFIGIVIEVVVLCGIIGLCEYRHRKKLEKEYEEADIGEEEDYDNVEETRPMTNVNHADELKQRTPQAPSNHV